MQKDDKIDPDVHHNSDQSPKEDQNIPQKEDLDINKIESLQEELLRAIAERENMRKRYEKQLSDLRDYAILDFAKNLLTVTDSLDSAIIYCLQNINSDEKNPILQGLKLTMTELEKVFGKFNIHKIAAEEGDDLDSINHHVIPSLPSEFEPGKIAKIVQNGYKIKDRVLRPAMVIVSK